MATHLNDCHSLNFKNASFFINCLIWYLSKIQIPTQFRTFINWFIKFSFLIQKFLYDIFSKATMYYERPLFSVFSTSVHLSLYILGVLAYWHKRKFTTFRSTQITHWWFRYDNYSKSVVKVPCFSLIQTELLIDVDLYLLLV